MDRLLVVTGAPGSGKTTTIETLLARNHAPYMMFDIDWMAESSSGLAGKSIYTEPSTWAPYGLLWRDILHSVVRNGGTPIFFCPNTPEDLEHLEQADWCGGLEWLSLDCNDDHRRTRLLQRPGWTEDRVVEALEDAQELRDLIPRQVDTSSLSPEQVAEAILDWAGNIQS